MSRHSDRETEPMTLETTTQTELDQLCINTIRTLSMDAVQAANSGHPGTPMAMAPVAYALWQRFLRFDPEDPIWPNRDRFVLSIGPRLDAALLAAAPDRREGGQPGLRDARRAVGHARRHQALPPARLARCPGHPEYRWTSGVETTTGPLGQGVATTRRHGDRRRSGWPRTSTGPASSCSTTTSTRSCGDGDMMEGISDEAASLAGHLQARRTSAGSTTTTTSPSRATPRSPSPRTSPTRFIGYGWNVTRVGDANDLDDARPRVRDVQERAATGRR